MFWLAAFSSVKIDRVASISLRYRRELQLPFQPIRPTEVIIFEPRQHDGLSPSAWKESHPWFLDVHGVDQWPSHLRSFQKL